MAAQDIIIRPVITEKSMSGMASKKYTFEVCKDANKIEIKKAVEEAERLNAGRKKKGMKPLCPLLVHVR